MRANLREPINRGSAERRPQHCTRTVRPFLRAQSVCGGVFASGARMPAHKRRAPPYNCHGWWRCARTYAYYTAFRAAGNIRHRPYLPTQLATAATGPAVRYESYYVRCYGQADARASSRLRMLLARAALARLRPPAAPPRGRADLCRAMASAAKEAIVSVTEVHATRWLRCAVHAALVALCVVGAEPTLSLRRLSSIKYKDAAGVERVCPAATCCGGVR